MVSSLPLMKDKQSISNYTMSKHITQSLSKLFGDNRDEILLKRSKRFLSEDFSNHSYAETGYLQNRKNSGFIGTLPNGTVYGLFTINSKYGKVV